MTTDTFTAIGRRHGFGTGAVEAALDALRAGRGMAQFSHPDLGGSGQWAPGMTMIGDLFNTVLKARVDALFSDLAQAMPADDAVGHAPASWWPPELGQAASTGSQNDTRYALFPDLSRLAVWRNGATTVYDTGGRPITGFGQQQSGAGSFTFSGPEGAVALDDLRIVGEATHPAAPTDAAPPEAPSPRRPPAADDPIATIERLADLHKRGILSEAEFQAKKTQLLSRIA